ncbi:MAG TPA: NAD(P)H-dependent oxidoreductase [Povalibacter sp.]
MPGRATPETTATKSPAPRLLLIYAGHEGGRTYELLDAVLQGIHDAGEPIELRTLPALEADTDDLLWAQGLLIGTPEHFGYMAGAIKDFMDRTFYPSEGKVEGLPYAVFVSAGNDGTGAVNSIERIAIGYKWKRVAEPVIVKGAVDAPGRQRCVDLGQMMAVGLSMGIF